MAVWAARKGQQLAGSTLAMCSQHVPQFPHLQAWQAWWFFSFTRAHRKLLAHHAFREVTKWGKVGDSAGKHNNVMNLSPARWQVNLAIWSPFEPVNKPQGAKSSQPVNGLLYRRSGWQHPKNAWNINLSFDLGHISTSPRTTLWHRAQRTATERRAAPRCPTLVPNPLLSMKLLDIPPLSEQEGCGGQLYENSLFWTTQPLLGLSNNEGKTHSLPLLKAFRAAVTNKTCLSRHSCSFLNCQLREADKNVLSTAKRSSCCPSEGVFAESV